MKTKWLDRVISPAAPFLCLCLSSAEYTTAAQHLGVTPNAAWVSSNAHATTHYYDNVDSMSYACVVCLSVTSELSGIEIAGILVHEAVHIWQNWCEYYGESSPASEQEAYAIQFISSHLMNEYSRRIT